MQRRLSAGDDPDWSDDYVSVRLDAQLRVVAAEAFSKGFGDLAEGEVVWGSEVSRTSFYAEPDDGDKAIDPEASLANPGAALLPKFDVFASPTTSLTEEGLPSGSSAPRTCSGAGKSGLFFAPAE